jgi:hypothetical protein
MEKEAARDSAGHSFIFSFRIQTSKQSSQLQKQFPNSTLKKWSWDLEIQEITRRKFASISPQFLEVEHGISNSESQLGLSHLHPELRVGLSK